MPVPSIALPATVPPLSPSSPPSLRLSLPRGGPVGRSHAAWLMVYRSLVHTARWKSLLGSPRKTESNGPRQIYGCPPGRARRTLPDRAPPLPRAQTTWGEGGRLLGRRQLPPPSLLWRPKASRAKFERNCLMMNWSRRKDRCLDSPRNKPRKTHQLGLIRKEARPI